MMTGYMLARALFVGTVAYTSWSIAPIAGNPWASLALGLGAALLIVAAEARLKDTAVTHLLGGLLGLGDWALAGAHDRARAVVVEHRQHPGASSCTA